MVKDCEEISIKYVNSMNYTLQDLENMQGRNTFHSFLSFPKSSIWYLISLLRGDTEMFEV